MSQDATDPKPNSDVKWARRTVWVPVVGGGALAIAYFIWFGGINDVPAERVNAGVWGAFGDFIGGILNPVVAGLALFWLTRSIEMQKEELDAVKVELKASKKAQQDQAETLAHQRFETSFYALLQQHNETLTKLNSPNSRNSNGLTDAEFVYTRVLGEKSELGEARAALEGQNDRTGHYFRVLFQLLKLVAVRCPATTFVGPFDGHQIIDSLPSSEEKTYTNIVRSFIGSDITQLLAVHCVCDPMSSFWAYKCLIERYSLLEHMPFKNANGEELLPLRALRSRYSAQAFDKSDYLVS